jgi:hypothetical protein
MSVRARHNAGFLNAPQHKALLNEIVSVVHANSSTSDESDDNHPARFFRPSPMRKLKGPGMNRAFRVSLFLLLALRMSLIAMLACSLRVLFGTARVLFALGVVTLAVMFGGGTMCLGSVFVVFGSLVVFVLGHGILVGC